MPDTITHLVTRARHELTARPDETVGKALSQVGSSHEAVFVLDNDDRFVGLVSPHALLYRHRVPFSTHVSSVMLQPPQLDETVSVYEVAGFMSSLRTYTLPIFDGGNVCGYIEAQAILRYALADTHIWRRMRRHIVWHKPLVAPLRTDAKSIYRLFRKHDIARVVLVQDTGTLAGIVARSDLMPLFVQPSLRERVGASWVLGGAVRSSRMYHDSEDTDSFKVSVEGYATLDVYSVSEHASTKDALEGMLANDVHSVVKIDADRIPIGFLSRSDFLRAIYRSSPSTAYEIQITCNARHMDDYYRQVARWYIEDFLERVSKRLSVSRVKVRLMLSYSASGMPSLYTTSIDTFLQDGSVLRAKKEHHLFRQSLQDTIEVLKRQLDT